MKQWKPVSGGNLEDLQHAELEFQHDLLYQTLLNPVQDGNLEDLPEQHDDEELECRRFATHSRAKNTIRS